MSINTFQLLEVYRKTTLDSSFRGFKNRKKTAPRGVKTILRKKLFLNRSEAAKILGCCPSALAGAVFTNSPWHGKIIAVRPHVVGPKGRLP
jgi:hypothetical protein